MHNLTGVELVSSNILKNKTILMFICFEVLWLDQAKDFQEFRVGVFCMAYFMLACLKKIVCF